MCACFYAFSSSCSWPSQWPPPRLSFIFLLPISNRPPSCNRPTSCSTPAPAPSVGRARRQSQESCIAEAEADRGPGAFVAAAAAMVATGKKPGVLQTQPMLADLETALSAKYTHYRMWEAADPKAFVAEHAQAIRAVVANASGASAELIDALPNLEIVASFSVGVNAIDIPRCREKGVLVTYTPDVLTDDCADMALSLLLATVRRVCAMDRYVRQGMWPIHGDFPLTPRLNGKRLGIVGLGRIGLAIAKRAEAFGCLISYYSRSEKAKTPYTYYSTVLELAQNCDMLMLSCALTKETFHLVGREIIDALGPEGTLINIARGPVVDEQELVSAILEGRLGAAGLDVYENEPHVPQELWGLDNVVLLPHAASLTWETRRGMGNLVVANLDAHFGGKPLVTPFTADYM